MEATELVLQTMREAGTPLNAGKIAELSGLDRKVVDKAMKELKKTGAIVSPLSLIIVGVMMSENSLVSILKERRAYVITLVRNLLIPFVILLLLRLIPLQSADRQCLLVLLACPCATLTTIYAIQNDMEPELAAHSVLMSTMFFALTLPLIVYMGTRLL